MANNKCLVLVCSVIVLFCLPNPAIPGSFTDYIKSECPSEFKKHKKTVKEFAIRMKPYVEDCGCGIVNLYYGLSNNNMDLIDQLEEDMDLVCDAAKIFEISNNLTNAFKESPDSVKTLVLLANNDPDIFHKLSKALSSFSRYDSRQLRKNSSYMLYYFLASAMINEDAQSSDLRLIVRNLKRKVSVEAVSALAMLYLQSIIVYPNADPNYWMWAAETTLESLGAKTVKSLNPYQEYLAFFLPPKEDNIPESQNLSTREIQKLRQNYMNLMAFVFDLIKRTYEKTAYSLMVIEHISPYLLEALRFHQNMGEIKAYLTCEFRSDNFKHVLQNGVCQSGVEDEGLRNFFIMYSPYVNGHPVPYTQGNLGLISKWFAEGKLRRYINDVEDINGYIYTMSLLPRIYLGLTQKQKTVFNELLFDLSYNPTLNGQVILALYGTTAFFSWLENSPDAFLNVTHNDEVTCGNSTQKFNYILLTSYPKDDSPSILHSFNGKSISSKAINDLMNMSITELEEHNFTASERYMAIAGNLIDIADWTVTAVSIAAVPLTAGLSTGLAVMMLTRKGAVTAAKRTIKTLAKRSLKSTSKLIGRGGWKVAKREAKEVVGFAAKRGRKAVREEALKKGIYKTEKWTDRIGLGSTASGVATGALAYFLANRLDSSESADLCDEIHKLSKGD